MEKIDKHLCEDAVLATIIPRLELPLLDTSNDIYLVLLDSVVSQQLSVKAATTIFNRFIDTFEDCNPSPRAILEKSIEELRACGLSGQKAGYLQNVAQYWIDNPDKDWMSMSDEEIIEDLVTIKGVGRWTVQMILMFKLGRMDVLPVDDLVIRQGIVKLYGLEETGKALIAKMHAVAEPWRPYRSVACRYIWKSKEL
jgi:DNA-3-methyladenine glycosylase II